MQQTTNYNLNKFDSTDELEDTTRLGLNENADTIDTALKGIQDDIDGLDASEVSYDNTVSGLTATDVQAALDEELGKIDILSNSWLKLYGVQDSLRANRSTDWEYAGVSVTIPPHSSFFLQAQAVYQATQPNLINICTSDTTQVAVASGAYAYPACTCVYIGNTADTSQTFYVWAKYLSAGSNTCEIRGFYLTTD